MTDKKSALLNAAKKLKNAKNTRPTQDEGNVKKIQNKNSGGDSLIDKIRNAVSKIDRD